MASITARLTIRSISRSRWRSTATATQSGTLTWATRNGSPASQVPSSPWRRGTARMTTTPRARKAAEEPIHSSWRRTSSRERRSRTTSESDRGDQARGDEQVADGEEQGRERALVVLLAVHEVARPGRQRPHRVQAEADQGRPTGPPPPRRRQVAVGGDEEDHDQGGEGRPAEQRGGPGDHLRRGGDAGSVGLDAPTRCRPRRPASPRAGWRPTAATRVGAAGGARR